MIKLTTIVTFMRVIPLVWGLLISTMLPTCLVAQSFNDINEGGEALFSLFSADQYKNHDENFAVSQDKRGIMYFGNFGGILEYDGVNWRTISTVAQTKVSALYYSKTGTMYVGARDEFGYLTPDKTGNLAFRSLSSSINTTIGEITEITEVDQQIIFISNKRIFVLKGNKIQSLALNKLALSTHTSASKVIVSRKDNTLDIFSLETKKITTSIKSDIKGIIDIVDVNNKLSLIFTQENGIYALSGNTISRYNCPANELLLNNSVTSIYEYEAHTVAIWSAKIGLVFINKDGSVNRIIREKIEDSRINKIFKDKDSNIWLAMDNGLAHLTINSPISQFASSVYDFGTINNIVRFDGKLCIATNKGLFYLDKSLFVPVKGIDIGCWALLPVNNKLVVASSNGVYLLSSVSAVAQRVNKEYSFCLARDRVNPNRVLVGNREGLAQVDVSGNTTVYQALEKYDDNITNITVDNEGDVWMESMSKGIFRYIPSTKSSTNYHYTSPDGELTKVGNHLLNSDQGIIVYNAKGVFQYSKSVDAFLPSSFLKTTTSTTSFKNTNWYGLIIRDASTDYWATRGDDKNIAYYREKGASFKKDSTRFIPIANASIRAIYRESNQVVWFGTTEGLLRFNLAFREQRKGPFQAYIRKIATNDSTLFNGFSQAGNDVDKALDSSGNVLLKSQINDLKFDFSATDYASGDELLFKYYLKNFEDNWSPWTTQSSKEYTNLVPGDYTFHVKAKNIYGVESGESTFSFTVNTPTYKRWWAILLYVVLGSILLLGLARWRLQKTKNERIKLENLIKERTEEIVDQKQELELQSEELAAKNDQLEKIDLIVQSINTEVDFSNLFQAILSKFSVIRNMDNGAFLIFDKASDSFRFRALRGIQDLSVFESVDLTREQAEGRYLSESVEVYEDIYYKNNFTFAPLDSPIDHVSTPKSLLTIVIKNEGQIEGFIILENISRSYAFDQRDINMIRNLKEHLIAAYIKTRLLENLENTLSDLKNTQDELIRQEKLASVGQLTKGIVDRILNPLNYVNNFSQSSDSIIEEIIEVVDQQGSSLSDDTISFLKEELIVLKKNQDKIQEHSNSTTRILKDMQKLLREKSRDFLETDLNNFIDSKARTVLQDIKTEYKDCPINLVMNLEKNSIRTKILPYEFGQVIHCLMSNSYYALYEKQKSVGQFLPEIRIETQLVKGQIFIRFRDNGKGMPKLESSKVFSPFFTTKPTSKGTGLGLFMVKDIIETHKGKVEIRSEEGEFTEILVTLPALNN
jgi:signal transduction histidine kinase/ligand-binding sensor domain-containing protein